MARHRDLFHLHALDRDPDEELVTAAYACAVAIHCDRGEPATAIRVGSEAWASARDEFLGSALARAYWEQAEATRDPRDHDAWAAFASELDRANGSRV